MNSPSVDPLIDPALVDDPFTAFNELRESDPVHRIAQTDVFAVSSLDLIHQVVADPVTYSSQTTEFLHVAASGQAELRSATGHSELDGQPLAFLATADPPDHTRQRRVLTHVLSNSAVNQREAELRELIRPKIEASVETGSIDWMRTIAEPVPLIMLARLLGAPDDSAGYLRTHGYAAVELTSGLATDERMDEIHTALMDLGPLGELYNSAKAGHGPDETTIIGACANAARSGDLDDLEALGIILMMAAAGGESTASLLGSGARVLADDGGLQQRLRAEPGLLPAFVEEACRLEPPFRGHYRTVRQDTELGGVAVPAGSRVMLLWPAANRDPRLVDHNADAVDVERSAPRQHVGFGWGIHLCIGAPLARLEARVGFEELLRATTSFSLADGVHLRHHPSFMVRRLVTLPLTLHGDPS